MNRFLKLIVSVLFFLSSFLPGLTGIADSISISLTGAPFYSLASSSDFLDDITDNNIIRLDENTGLIDNILLVFLNDSTSLLQRYQAFKSVGGLCIGYLEPANLFVLSAAFDTPDEMKALCDTLMQKDGVLFASGSFAFKNEENLTPNDPFDGLFEGRDVWNDASPAGGTWWLEAIEARNAWAYEPYFNHIKIGIIDSGFDIQHPDLLGKITFPSRLLARQNSIGSHGTHVAGIIGAVGNNSIGIKGITQNSTLVCVDWQKEEGQVWIEDLRIIFGVGYAIKAGAKVVNLSLGSSGSIPEGKPAYPRLWMDAEAALISIYTAILLNRGYDFVIVQSAGNGDTNGNPVDAINNGSFCTITESNSFSSLLGVPAKEIIDRIIVTGSARNLGSGRFIQSGFSNVGDQVAICAPGSSVYSCDLEDRNFYSYKSGTSMAAPVVTAVTSLVWSVNPSLTGAQVKAIVCGEENTSYDVPETNDQFWASVPYRSYRMVNAKMAVEAAVKTLHATGEVSGTATDANGLGKACEINVVSGENEFIFSCSPDGRFDFILPPGPATLTFTAADNTGAFAQITVTENESLDLGSITLV